MTPAKSNIWFGRVHAGWRDVMMFGLGFLQTCLSGRKVLKSYLSLKILKTPKSIFTKFYYLFSPLNCSFAALLYQEKRLFANTFYIRYCIVCTAINRFLWS